MGVAREGPTMAFSCDDCDRDDFRTERGLTAHRTAKHPPQRHGPVAEATNRAIKAARHLEDADCGPVEVLRTLARTIDGIPERPADAPMDNVTIPTYLKFASALGLTPVSRKDLVKPEAGSGSKLAQLRSIQGGRGA